MNVIIGWIGMANNLMVVNWKLLIVVTVVIATIVIAARRLKSIHKKYWPIMLAVVSIIVLLCVSMLNVDEGSGIIPILGWALGILVAAVIVGIIAYISYKYRARIYGITKNINLGEHKYLLGTSAGLVAMNLLVWLLFPEFWLNQFWGNKRLFVAFNLGILGIAFVKNIKQESGKKWGKVLAWILAIGVIYNVIPTKTEAEKLAEARKRSTPQVATQNSQTVVAYPGVYSEPLAVPSYHDIQAVNTGKMRVKVTRTNGTIDYVDDLYVPGSG